MQWPSPTLFTNNNINLPADMSAIVCENFHKIFKEIFHSSEMQKVTGTKKTKTHHNKTGASWSNFAQHIAFISYSIAEN